jgi:4-hydroxy-3-polyprenylbenzoate decarboxylase
VKKKIVVAICGASGSIYGLRLLKALLSMPVSIYLIISKTGFTVLEHETNYKPRDSDKDLAHFLKAYGITFHKDAHLQIFDETNFFAPPASGSFVHHGMVIAPCSMKTLGAIASGIADNLIHRAADVCLKEKRPLIMLTRETPLSHVHLKNMLAATVSGATIMPPCPGFYFKPKTIEELVDSIIARVLAHLNFEHNLIRQWGEPNIV